MWCHLEGIVFWGGYLGNSHTFFGGVFWEIHIHGKFFGGVFWEIHIHILVGGVFWEIHIHICGGGILET